MQWFKIISVTFGPGLAVAVVLAPLIASEEFRHTADLPHIEVGTFSMVSTTAGPTLTSTAGFRT